MTSTDAPDAPLPDAPMAASTVRELDEVKLHTVAAGDPDDPLVVLLHGFPEFWYGWRDAVGPLVDAGFRVLVPDQRGYNRSDRPDGVRPYRIGALSRDVRQLIRTEDQTAAHVVGHDWGALVAWDLACRHPDTVDRLGIVNVPHPAVWRRTVLTNPQQLLKSWYVFYFQLPRLPEWGSARDDFALWEATLRSGSNPGTFTDEDFRHYRRAWGRDGAPTAMINWYRALLRHPDRPQRQRVTAPTLIVWGEGDAHLVPEMAPKSLAYCADGQLETFEDATHWIVHEHPDRVAGVLADHLGA